jgi:hypothetical protein
MTPVALAAKTAGDQEQLKGAKPAEHVCEPHGRETARTVVAPPFQRSASQEPVQSDGSASLAEPVSVGLPPEPEFALALAWGLPVQ